MWGVHSTGGWPGRLLHYVRAKPSCSKSFENFSQNIRRTGPSKPQFFKNSQRRIRGMQKHPKEVAIGSSSNHLRRCCLFSSWLSCHSLPFSLVTIHIVRFSLSCSSTELYLCLSVPSNQIPVSVRLTPSGYVLLILLVVTFSDLNSFSLSESSAHNPSLLQCHRLSCSVFFPVIPLLSPPHFLIHPQTFLPSTSVTPASWSPSVSHSLAAWWPNSFCIS